MKTTKRKGITPIIAIVILLLITIAIAGVAYTFISGIVGSTAGKSALITATSCDAASGNLVVSFKNTGTEALTAGVDGISGANGQCVVGTCDTGVVVGTGQSLTPSPNVPPQSAGTLRLPCDDFVTTGASACSYDILVSGTLIQRVTSPNCGS